MLFPIRVRVYANLQGLTRVGEIIVLYDRIVSGRFKIPVSRKKLFAKRNKTCSTFFKKSEEIFEAYELKDAYPFKIEKTCKAEWPYRKYQLTHKLVCDNLKKIYSEDLFIKLSLFQRTVIAFHHKKFIWQSKPFRQKLCDEVAKWLLISLLGSIGTYSLILLKENSQNTERKSPVVRGKENSSGIRQPSLNEKTKELKLFLTTHE